ncbi:MAG: DinB family protein [Dehalococcoidia bacterium]|nr:DinB family protein [Dehalococcoidia bacterium]
MPDVRPDAQPSTPVVVRLFRDALHEYGRHIENVPPPGRGGPVGRLSNAAWTAAHGAATLDKWVNAYCAAAERDPWCADFEAQPHSAPVAFLDAQAAFERVRARAEDYVVNLAEGDLARVAPVRPDSFLEGQRVGHLLIRAVAHLFAHAGELSVTSSLLRRADLGLPGALPGAYGAPLGPAEAGDAGLPILARFVLDAREAFLVVAEGVPVPAQRGAFDRLNSGGWIVAHIAEQEDQYWSVHAQLLEADPWLAEAHVRFGDPASQPPYPEALAALRAALARGTPYLESLTAERLAEVVRRSRIPERGDQRVQDLLLLQGTHLYALAGELAAISSLAGGEDPDLPRTMAHTIAWTGGAGA